MNAPYSLENMAFYFALSFDLSILGFSFSHLKATTEFEDLIAGLKISARQAPPPPPPAVQVSKNQPDGPLSPQSFAMVRGAQRQLNEI